MERWKGWLCFKWLTFFPTKSVLHKVTSHFRYKPKGERNGLVSLYKDMESFGEYEDIQVMWKILHSSSTQYAYNIKRSKRSAYWRFCFRST
ncbi:U-box domain-containing protein [Quillaja saponaria]|uniref:U-box domain-containing protein n=1 Tax=Quillaja saponaria TaxID=32244 RepID=A0AAD7L1W3_QUISA|nr:U-box domain-containing protein [Quillaja saponaria]